MKLTFLFLLIGLMHVSASVYSQSTKLSLEMRNAKVAEVLDAIENQSEFRFAYSPGFIDLEREVTVDINEKTIDESLKVVFANTDVDFGVFDRHILLYPKEMAPGNQPVISHATGQQQPAVSGTVTDEAGEPLPGVTVAIKGTTQGTVTNGDGEYSLTEVPDDATLVFSFVGMQTQEVEVENQTIVNVTMESQTIGVDEVVVVGFAKRERENISGAVSSIKMDDVLGDRPVSDAAKAIQGAIPGFQVTHGTGQPGTTASLNVRGFESITGGSPLILVDNIPMRLEDVNPRDIEEVTVLKDAAAASIYGARAAFGVVLITTKKGSKAQPLKFEYSNNFNFSSPSALPAKASPLEFVSALNDWGQITYWTGQNVETWIDYINQYNNNPTAYPDGYIEDDSGLKYWVQERDLINEFMGQSGFEQSHNFAFSGSSESSFYRVSMGYSNEDGIMVTDKDSYTRYNANLSLTTDITNKITNTSNVIYTNGLRTTPRSGNFGEIYYNAITFHSAIPKGFGDYEGQQVPYYTPANLIIYEPENSMNDENLRFFTKTTFKPVEDLDINAEYTFEKFHRRTENPSYIPAYIHPATLNYRKYDPGQSFYALSGTSRKYHGLNLYGNYGKTLGDSKFNLLAGMNLEEGLTKGFSVSRTELLSPSNPGLSTANGILNASDSYSDFGILGFFGRINYSYKKKYLLEANGRYDGSSRFPPGSRFGFFPSVSGAWVVSRESFMSSLQPFVNNFKLRSSFGEIGNQNIANYAYIPSMNPANATWVNADANIRAITLNPPGLVSSNFTWERVRTFNMGFDLSLLNNRLFATFDRYNRQTLNMLAPGEELPAVLGAAAPLQNVADLKTIGWELEIKWTDHSKEFKYSIGLNLYDHMTEITNFDNEAGLLSQYYVGRNTGEIWGYVTDGFYTVDDFVDGTLNENLTGGTLKEGVPKFKGVNPNPGDVKYLDLNDDGEIFSGNNTLDDPGDRKIIGNSTRRLQFGINGSATYKGFDLSFLLRGVGKRDLWISNPVFWPYLSEFQTIYKHQLDYWTPDNTDAFYPRNYPNAGGNYGNSRQVQTKYLSNGAFLRVQNITFGYVVNSKLLQHLKIDRLKFFVSGENLFNFDYLPDGLDAELSNLGQGGTYPYMKKISLGLNLTF